MFRSTALAAALATTFCLPALAELGPPREAAPLSRLFPMFEDYLALDQDKRSHFELTYALNASDEADNGFRLWVERASGNVEITRTDDGLVDMDQIVGLLPGNPMIMTDLPAGRGNVSMKLLPTLELGDEIAMEDVCTALSQANAAIRKQAGLMSFAAPKMKGIGFSLQPGTDGGARLTMQRPSALSSLIPSHASDTLRGAVDVLVRWSCALAWAALTLVGCACPRF